MVLKVLNGNVWHSWLGQVYYSAQLAESLANIFEFIMCRTKYTVDFTQKWIQCDVCYNIIGQQMFYSETYHMSSLAWHARETFNAKDPRNNLILVCRVKNQTVSSQTAALHSPADFYGNSVWHNDGYIMLYFIASSQNINLLHANDNYVNCLRINYLKTILMSQSLRISRCLPSNAEKSSREIMASPVKTGFRCMICNLSKW